MQAGKDVKLERTLALVALGLLSLGCLVVMRPFFSALIWAVVLSFSSWPVYAKLLRWVGGRSGLAATLMTLGLALGLLLPFGVIGLTLADSVKEFAVATRKWLDAGPPSPPAWLNRVPAVGPELEDYWVELAQDSTRLFQEVKGFIEPASARLVHGGLVLGRGLIDLALSIFIAFFLFRHGLAMVERLRTAVVRLGGEQGPHLLEVAGGTVRGVVYGILGTALAQAVLAGVGYTIAGIPGAGLLTLLTFFFAVIPLVGPTAVWLPASIWLFQNQSTGWGIFMLVWGIVVSSFDNVLRPYLISQESRMPFILIFFGVVGGALTFGFIGIFLGPTLLTVGFRLLEEWIRVRRPAVPPAGPSDPPRPASPATPATPELTEP